MKFNVDMIREETNRIRTMVKNARKVIRVSIGAGSTNDMGTTSRKNVSASEKERRYVDNIHIGMKKSKMGQNVRLKPSQRKVDKGTVRCTQQKKTGLGA